MKYERLLKQGFHRLKNAHLKRILIEKSINYHKTEISVYGICDKQMNKFSALIE